MVNNHPEIHKKQKIHNISPKVKNNIFNIYKNDRSIHQNIRSNGKIDRNKVLNYIRGHSPINIYELAKDLKINYNSAWSIVKGFEIAGLIIISDKTSDKNRKMKMVKIK